MNKEINNTNIFRKLLPNKKFRKFLLHISLAKVQDYQWLNQWFKLPETAQNSFNCNERKQFHFRQTNTDNQNISSNSAEDTNNKFKK